MSTNERGGQNSWAHLENEETEEIKVGRPLELLEQVERQEGDELVLGGLDVIVLKQVNRAVSW